MKSVLILTLLLVGCASGEAHKDEPSAVTKEEAPATAPAEQEGSDVLARKDPNAKKCPKRAKLVNGKCLMKVEETE